MFDGGLMVDLITFAPLWTSSCSGSALLWSFKRCEDMPLGLGPQALVYEVGMCLMEV